MAELSLQAKGSLGAPAENRHAGERQVIDKLDLIIPALNKYF